MATKTVDNGALTDIDIDFNAGAVGADTQRFTLGSDDPAVVDLAAIEVLLTGIDEDTAAIQSSLADQVNIRVSPTVTAGAYSTGDAMGGLMEFGNAAKTSGGSGIILGVTVVCKTPSLAWTGLELVLFDRSVTVAADNDANAYSDADALFMAGPPIKLSDWVDYTNQSVVGRQLLYPFKLNATSLYGQLVTRSGITLTSTSDIQVQLDVLRN